MVIVGHGFIVVRNFYLFRVLHHISEPVMRPQIDKCVHRSEALECGTRCGKINTVHLQK